MVIVERVEDLNRGGGENKETNDSFGRKEGDDEKKQLKTHTTKREGSFRPSKITVLHSSERKKTPKPLIGCREKGKKTTRKNL